MEKEIKKESFILHADYILDIPEENRTDFFYYIFNYAVYGEEPDIKGFEKSVWLKIKRRMDAETKAYKERKEYDSLYAEFKKAKKEGVISQDTDFKSFKDLKLLKSFKSFKSFNTNENISNISPYTDTNTRRVYDNESVSESVNVNEYVSDNVSDIDNVSDNESVSDIADTALNISEPQKNYCHEIFVLWKSKNLPGSKNELTFMQRDFKQSLSNLKGYSSNEVIEAVKNYISILEWDCTFDPYKTPKTFEQFTKWEKFKNFLPDNFSKESFKDFSKKEKAPVSDWTKKEREFMMKTQYVKL